MIMPAAALYDSRHVVVQHLMEHHRLDEKARHPSLIEHGMNPNQTLLWEICSQLQRALPALRLNALAPGDADVGLSAKMPTRQVFDDRAQVVVSPARPQNCLRRPSSNESRAVLFDEAVDRARRVCIAVAQIVTHGIQNVLLSGQEHVVKANLEPSSLGTGGQHGAAVVGDNEPDGLPQAHGQRSAPIGCAGVGAVQVALTTLWRAGLGDRRRFSGKLEGKLKHAIRG